MKQQKNMHKICPKYAPEKSYLTSLEFEEKHFFLFHNNI